MVDRNRLTLIIPLLTTTLIFVLTAAVGVWAAPDRSAAVLRLGLFIVGLVLMLGIAYGPRRPTERTFGVLGLIGAALAAVLAVHFLLTVNWAEAGPQRLPLLHQIGFWIHSHSPELSRLPNLHKNITGGMLVILLPLGLSGTIWAAMGKYRFVTAAASVALIVGLFGLIMTISRGAWLGLGLALGYTAYFVWRYRPGRLPALRWLVDLLIAAFTVIFLAGFFLLATAPESKAIPSLSLAETSGGRPELWHDSLVVIQDYPFTGSGLGNTTMVYSSYVFLLHVPFISHAHNLYLQIAIEQGLPGLIAFAAMVVFAVLGLRTVYQQGSFLVRIHSAATFAALVAMLGHGMVEAGLYAHLLLPVIFLPFGATLGLLLTTTDRQAASWSAASVRRANRLAIAGSLGPAIAIAGLFLLPGALAALQANMGAVSQTQAELSVYRWPEWPIQDELRRSDAVDLSPAIGYYNHALAIDPANVTAHRRLGQIALSRGQYELAQQHLETAYQLAPDQRPTRQMLGEIYAVNGDLDQAVQLWRTVDTTRGQLDARDWWYTHLGTELQADRLQQAINQLRLTK